MKCRMGEHNRQMSASKPAATYRGGGGGGGGAGAGGGGAGYGSSRMEVDRREHDDRDRRDYGDIDRWVKQLFLKSLLE